jgi:hypothetical protein
MESGRTNIKSSVETPDRDLTRLPGVSTVNQVLREGISK